MAMQIYGETTDGRVFDTDATWSNLDVDGASLPSPTANTGSTVGQITRFDNAGTLNAQQLFFAFDTSATSGVTSAKLSLNVLATGAQNIGNQTLRLLAHDWYPAPLATADYLGSSSFSSYTTLADVVITDGQIDTRYEWVFSDTSAVNEGGTTAVHLVDVNQATAPTDGVDETALTIDMTDQTGIVDDPWIEIEEGSAPQLISVTSTIPHRPPPRMVGY